MLGMPVIDSTEVHCPWRLFWRRWDTRSIGSREQDRVRGSVGEALMPAVAVYATLLAVCLFMSACRGDDPPRSVVTARDSAGVAIVVNVAGSQWRANDA